MSDLGFNEAGRPIVGAKVIVRKTGDGLSESVKVDPSLALAIKQGDEGFIVFEYKCVDVHQPAEDRKNPGDGGVFHVPVLDAGTATFMDAESVASAIRDQRERNERFREEQRGQHQLSDAELIADHDDGKHKGDVFPVEHCPRCADEVDAVAAEAAADGETGGDEVGARRRGRGK